MTHKYRVEMLREFRGHFIPVNKPQLIEVGAYAPDRTVVIKAKEAFGLNGVKTDKQDLGNTILLKFKKNKNHRLSIQFCH
jgi:hypothetical protein